MRLDLHTHSNASDGTLAPRELVFHAAQRDVGVLALTDHDSLEGIAEAADAAREAGITLIPAVELSVGPARERDIHILGYFVDPQDPVLGRRLEGLRDARLQRARGMVEALRQAGFAITLDEVLDLADNGAVGRAHVARTLVQHGHASSVDEAFDRYLSRGRPYYQPKPATDPADVVEVLIRAGAVPVLAHPGLSGADDLIPALVEAGLAGIEAFHADHSLEDRERYERLARSLGLLVTGGSDFHGPDTPSAPIGSVDMPDYVLHELLEAAPVRPERF